MSSIVSRALETQSPNRASMPPRNAWRSVSVLPWLRSAQSLTWRAVAAIRKWGSGRKKMREEAAARWRMTLGDAFESAVRRVLQDDEALTRSSMLWRKCGSKTSRSIGRSRSSILISELPYQILSSEEKRISDCKIVKEQPSNFSRFFRVFMSLVPQLEPGLR